jgi:HTH-type transcriptional regulator/antitoxin HigA
MSAKLKPFINIGPGQIISRNLEALNWTNKDLSDVIGMSEKSISQMINNKQSITVDTAILLGKAFNTSPEFWLNLEHNYRLREKGGGNDDQNTEAKAKIRTYMPVLEMKKKGWIVCDRDAASQIHAYKKFWGVKDLDYSPYEEKTSALPFCARKGKPDAPFTKYYSITWHRKALIEAAKIKAGTYNKDKLELLYSSIGEYTLRDNGLESFIKALLSCGVKFFVLSHLPKTYLDGAAFHDGKNPVIVYTARYDRVDNFWWTIAHEISHVLRHIKSEKDCFLDNLEDRTGVNDQEVEADRDTARILKVEEIIAKADPFKTYFTESRLAEVSRAVSLSPAVVIGILHHYKLLDWRTLAKVKEPVMGMMKREWVRG